MKSPAQVEPPPASPVQTMHQSKVAILLCTYNGAKYLQEQLDSFERQTHTHWQAWASDDGSTDDTAAILRRCQEKWGAHRLVILEGPKAGSTRNFMSLVHHRGIQAHYYAFSDQDDIWEDDKLERAVAWLEGRPPALPALYGTRTRIVDEHNTPIGYSPLYTRPPGFLNALTQNIASGNTMVFNAAARPLLGEPGLDVFIHDWWAYLAITACGGTAHYDAYPSLRYRQHQDNQIGISSAWTAVHARAGRLLAGRFKIATDKNLAAVQTLCQAMPAHNREILERYGQARTKGPVARMAAIRQLGLYQQTWAGNMGLFIAALFNKL